MKRKFFSVGVIIVLIASLLMFAGPASAGSLAWSVQPTPTFLFNQVAAGTDVVDITVAPNGDLFAIDGVSDNIIYKSVDGGRNWTASLPLAPTGNILDLAVSPSYATDSTIVAVGNPDGLNAQVYISTNGGISYSVLGGPIASVNATSVAVAPNYSGGVGEIMVGCIADGPGTYGDVYIWGYNSILTWTDTGLNKDVASVAYSPNYAIDGTRVAVAAHATGGTTLDTLIAAAAWNGGTIGSATIDATVNETGGTNAELAGANVAFPNDFNASSAFNRTCYVALRSTGGASNDNIFRIIAGLGSAVPMEPLDSLFGTGTADHPIQSIVYSGTGMAGTLYAAPSGGAASTTVYKCAVPTAAQAAIQWTFSLAAPSGSGPTYLALANDFTTSNKMYAGTSGANSALSVSDDGGTFFYQSGMIDTAIAAIDDFVAASSDVLFLATNNGTNPQGIAGATVGSVWKSSDAGASWYRYATQALTVNTTAAVRISPDYATDMTVLYADITGLNMWVSNNGGSTWTNRVSPINIGDIALRDQYTFYIGGSGAGTVQSTVNGGWTWQPRSTTVATTGGPATISDIEIDVATGHVLVCGNSGAAGVVYLSTDGNVKYVIQGLSGVGNAATVLTLAFDTDYASNNIIYAADTAGNLADVNRWTVGSSTAWITLGSAVVAGAAGDIMMAPDGTLYVSETTASVAPAGPNPGVNGLSRSINPTAGIASTTMGLVNWNDGITSDLPNGSVLGTLSLVEGSNIIYAVDATLNRIYTYTDTLTTAIPNVTGPADDVVLEDVNVTFTFDAVPGALTYRVRYDLRSDWQTALEEPSANFFDTFIRVTGLTQGATYFWQVRVDSPVIGPWSEARTLTAQLSAAEGFNAPGILGTADGGTAAGGVNAPLTPTFAWAAVKGATGYEFQLATDSGFTNLLIDLSGANALGAVNAYTMMTPLDYSTTYYWQVRAFTATSTTDWSGAVPFTTLSATAPPPTSGPPVVVEQVPAPTFTMPAAPPAQTITIPPAPEPDQIAPGYIWAVIIIGAVLVIALIVLIVRTRRSV